MYLQEVKLKLPAGSPADLSDYLLSRKDEPCGRSVPEAIVTAIRWLEAVAEFPDWHGRRKIR